MSLIPTTPQVDPRGPSRAFVEIDDDETPLQALRRFAAMLRQQAPYVPTDYFETRFQEWARFIDAQRRRLEDNP